MHTVKRLTDTVGKENVDYVSELYAEAYKDTDLTPAEIWEELICDSLGDMNIFAQDEAQRELFDLFIPDVQKAVSETKTAAKTSEGVTEGKASRNLSHRNKRLYVFPPYNESQSDANEIATRWAHREDVKVGHQRIVSYHGNFYLIEKFDSAELGYQIVDHLTKRQYNEYVKEYGNGENISEQSIKEISGEIDSFNREGDWAGRGEYSSSSSSVGQRGENIQVQRVGENKIEGGQDTGDRGGNLRSGITNKQKYSRELDLEYLSAVERGDMETAQRMVDEAAKAAGYTSDFDWRMNHRAPNSHDDTGHSLDKIDKSYGGDGSIYSPHAVYYYGEGRRYDAKAIRVIQSARNKPDAPIRIYRAVPTNIKDTRIRNGDWVTIVREYAEEHGYRSLDDDYRIIENVVPAKYLYNAGDSINEFGYDNGNTDEVYSNTENNVKLAAVTYDDNGKVIPLSERFNPEKSDIRYSRELDIVDYATGDVRSPRKLLANVLMSAAQSPAEQAKIREYRDNIEKLNEQERKLQQLLNSNINCIKIGVKV